MEIDLPLTTVKVEAETIRLSITIRSFYQGFWDKLLIRWVWLFNYRKKPFQEYLDTPVTYVTEPPDSIKMYHNIHAEADLVKILEEQIQLDIEKEKEKWKN